MVLIVSAADARLRYAVCTALIASDIPVRRVWYWLRSAVASSRVPKSGVGAAANVVTIGSNDSFRVFRTPVANAVSRAGSTLTSVAMAHPVQMLRLDSSVRW